MWALGVEFFELRSWSSDARFSPDSWGSSRRRDAADEAGGDASGATAPTVVKWHIAFIARIVRESSSEYCDEPPTPLQVPYQSSAKATTQDLK